jgi:hypothetical protein
MSNKGGDMNREENKNKQTDKRTTTGTEREHTSATRGGTTDMDQRTERDITGDRSTHRAGSGISTKHAVTGSDYDGQVKE